MVLRQYSCFPVFTCPRVQPSLFLEEPSILKVLPSIVRRLWAGEGSLPSRRLQRPGSCSQGFLAVRPQAGGQSSPTCCLCAGVVSRQGENRGYPRQQWPPVSANWGQEWQWGLESNISAHSVQEWPGLSAPVVAFLGLGPFPFNPPIDL